MTPEQLEAFAKILARARADLKLTKTKFGELIGVTRSTVRSLETGKQHPSPETLEHIAAATGKSIAALTGGAPSIDPKDPLLTHLHEEDLEVAQAYHHAPLRVKQRVLGVLQERGTVAREPVPTDVHAVARMFLALTPELRETYRSLIERSIKSQSGNPGRTLRHEVTADAPATAPDQPHAKPEGAADPKPHRPKARG